MKGSTFVTFFFLSTQASSNQSKIFSEFETSEFRANAARNPTHG